MAQVRRALQTYCDVLPTIALLSGQWNSFSLAYKFPDYIYEVFFVENFFFVVRGQESI